MQVEVYPDAQGAGRAVARMVARFVQVKPDSVLGLATGHTMAPLYGELVRLHEEESVSFKDAVAINLDEYVGLGTGHVDSLREFMMLRLISQIDLPVSSFNILRGRAHDLDSECERYAGVIEAAGGIDLQLLGLGRNGHIGFNEPGSAADSRVRVVDLTETTKAVNAGDFRKINKSPAKGITLGVADVLDARRIVMMVTGWEKAEILHRTLTTAPTADVPATFLHPHSDVILVADREAMELFYEREREQSLSFSLAPPTG